MSPPAAAIDLIMGCPSVVSAASELSWWPERSVLLLVLGAKLIGDAIAGLS
jgi:hypothetical protein